ncbi:uncharacterized protein KGF55_004721 [Candida pseudojiufengensis]|uniref:uncharacterized protein n=1 Tax=Candida pseudojiufengensis TaxID=497109 RepID=UPI0022255DA9|nr:uncharacterized protein KGF55_004721 [Candida pseudojiufengensis]KAI5960429.1 hypothetical protein KGF55_004721 [Candida pseudojiufengensis]
MTSNGNLEEKLPQRITPLTIEELKLFPLPKQLNSLPNKSFEQFIENRDLIIDYMQGLETYQQKVNEIRQNLEFIVDNILLQKVKIESIPKYQKLIHKINNQIKTLNQLYNEFLNLETIQYQLISSNFNLETLKIKFKKLIEQNNQQSLEIVKEYNKNKGHNENDNDELNEMLINFRTSRKQYHFRKEKLNRWEEERVSGFI